MSSSSTAAPIKAQEDFESTNIKLSFRQRADYAVSDFGYNLIYIWISSFMAIFLTDHMGIAAAAVSFLTLAVRVFDAVNDPIIGAIADRTHDKGKGRYKPWVRWGGIAMALGIVLMFSMQENWSMGFKLTYMWVIYLFITVASTCCNMPYGAMNGILTSNYEERGKLSSLRMVFANLGSNLTGVIAVPLIIFFAGRGGQMGPRGFMIAVILCVAIGLPTIIYTSYRVKEVVKPPVNQVKIPLGKQLKAFFANKYALIIAAGFFCMGFSSYGRMTVAIYYFTYNCGNPDLMSIYSALGLAAGLIGSGLVAPWLLKVMNKSKCIMLTYAVGAVFAYLGYILPPGSAIWLAASFVSMMGANAGIGIAFGVIGDAVDYGEYKTGVRVDGFISSFISLMLKVGGAVGPAILIAWLGRLGYAPNAAQSPEVLNALNLGVNVVTGALFTLLIIMYVFYDLTPEKHEKIRIELERRRMEALKEADATVS